MSEQAPPPGFEPGMDPKAAAKAAKAYAKATRPWYKKKRWILALAIVAIIVIAVATSGGGGDDGDSGGDSGDSSGDSAKPVVTAKAADLIKEFEDNELNADEKYKGKRVEVSGVVSKIDTELLDDSDYVLKVNGGGELEILTVDCYDIPNDKLSALKPGDDVTMVGDFKDGGDLGVELNHCSLK